MAKQSTGHGWWPYLGPYVAFLVTVLIASELPESWGPALLIVKPAVPAGLLIYFFRRGDYPELTRIRLQPAWNVLDVLVGIALAALWVGPFLVFDLLPPVESASAVSAATVEGARLDWWGPLAVLWDHLAQVFRPPGAADGFDPTMAGTASASWILGLRLAGFAIVTPIFEELFVRCLVMRVAETYGRSGDFRDIPLARYSLRSFVVTMVVFTGGHDFWEWPVALPWIAISTLWFYLRKDLGAVILLHAATNASILFYVVWATKGVPGGPLWIFV